MCVCLCVCVFVCVCSKGKMSAIRSNLPPQALHSQGYAANEWGDAGVFLFFISLLRTCCVRTFRRLCGMTVTRMRAVVDVVPYHVFLYVCICVDTCRRAFSHLHQRRACRYMSHMNKHTWKCTNTDAFCGRSRKPVVITANTLID